MLVQDLVGLSFHNLFLHKIRSLLTSLGIIFGVGSVIAMLAISGGAKQKALAQIEAMGVENILVYSKKPSVESKDIAQSGSSRLQTYGITDVDVKNFTRFENVDSIMSLWNTRQKIYKGSRQLDVQMIATTTNFPDITNSQIISGRWINAVDEKNSSPVCVIGKSLKRKLFNLGEQNIVGKRIVVGSGIYKVVGILENNVGTTFPNIYAPNDLIYVPRATAKKLLGYNLRETSAGSYKVYHIEHDLLILKTKDVAYIDNTAKRLERYMTKSHTTGKDWGISIPLDLLKQQEETQNIFTIVMGSIAGISLIVGGIGIMNIMLANVYERRKEIGTRRAIGAKKSDILYQFLIETVFLTLMGGIIGVALGVGLSHLVTLTTKMPSDISLWSIVASLGISAFVGIVFGTYPAWKAANQNPIDALRAE